MCAATGATSWDVAVDADESGGTVTVTRVLPAEVPDAVRRIVGETVTVTQTETWEPRRPTAPGRVTSTSRSRVSRRR